MVASRRQHTVAHGLERVGALAKSGEWRAEPADRRLMVRCAGRATKRAGPQCEIGRGRSIPIPWPHPVVITQGSHSTRQIGDNCGGETGQSLKYSHSFTPPVVACSQRPMVGTESVRAPGRLAAGRSRLGGYFTDSPLVVWCPYWGGALQLVLPDSRFLVMLRMPAVIDGQVPCSACLGQRVRSETKQPTRAM